MLDRTGRGVVLEANSDATVLLLSGEPIDEPIVGYGPFVMNSEAEIRRAITDFNSGRFGEIRACSRSNSAACATAPSAPTWAVRFVTRGERTRSCAADTAATACASRG